MPARFEIMIRSPELRRNAILANGTDFKLGDTDLDSMFQISLPKRERDLLRIMMGVYVADRLVRRPRRRQDRIGPREIELRVSVAQPDFWTDAQTCRLLQDVVRRLSNDFWSFQFDRGHAIPEQLTLLPESPGVSQYSGGLDSAAGLSHRLSTDSSPVMTVTAAHQSFHGRLTAQIAQISKRYGAKVRPVICRTRLANAPRFSRQETTQRLRGALFTALGGAVASAVRAETVDVFENGIGAINLPPQSGMMLGAMATRGCQPGFLASMGRLVSHVAERTIRFQLPMLRTTKAEAVRGMVRDGLEDVVNSTMSCVHWPLRNAGPAKHCGTCFACIGRRQAMLAAGVLEPENSYEVDLFGSHDTELYNGSRLLPLKASLMQVVDLRCFCERGTPPHGFYQHLADAEVSNFGMSVAEVVQLHRRYVDEWQQLISGAKAQGLRWASWIKRVGMAA
jgi:7-cyano-7-deazaguanine synthase in queuosine biosynthesis